SNDVAQKTTGNAGSLGMRFTRSGYIDAEGTIVREAQVALKETTVGMRVGTHAAVACGCECGKFGTEAGGAVKKRLGVVAAHPMLQQAQVLRLVSHLIDRHLVGAPETLNFLSVHLFRTSPAFRGAHDDERPPRHR